MKKRNCAMILAVTICAAAAAGCGSGGSGSTTAAPAATTAAAETKAAETKAAEETKAPAADAISIKAAHTGNENTTYQVGMKAFKEYVEEHSAGKYVVEIYPATLGGDSDLYEGLQIGTVDFAEVNCSVLSSTVNDLKVIDLPFMFENREQAYAVLDGEIGDKLLQEVRDQCGIHAVCFWENGFRDFTNSKRPIKLPEDLNGLNMRVMQSDIMMDTFKNWGCNVSAMNISETITAMQSGVIDGHDNNPDTVVSNSMWEYQGYFSDSQHFYGAKTLNFSHAFWDKLSAEDQQMFTEAAQYARDVQRKEVADRYNAAIAKLEENGMEVVHHDEIDMEAWKASVQPIWDKNAEALGSLIEEVQAAFN